VNEQLRAPCGKNMKTALDLRLESALIQAHYSTMLPPSQAKGLSLKGYEPIGGCRGSSSVLAGKPGNEVLIPAAWEADKTRGNWTT
jgi:hypothetical protein